MVAPLYLTLLHQGMIDKQGHSVTTSLTMIDVHDIARSARTYGVQESFIAHPSPTLRKLARTLKSHWEEGFGASYNPNRKDALSGIRLASDLDEVIHVIDTTSGELPILVATSAHAGDNRVSFEDFKQERATTTRPYLLMFGTGWGMGPELMRRADIVLEPLCGPTEYNHLSVRSACAIVLDRLCGV